MLDLIFGNKNAERVLLHIFHYGEIHASGISHDYHISLTPILNQLNKFELSGILVSKEIGKSRHYSFNPKSALTKPIKEMLRIVYENIPIEERERLFNNKRRRPR